jgi:hypothetical protein
MRERSHPFFGSTSQVLYLKPASHGQLQNLILFVCGRFWAPGVKPSFNGFLKIAAQFVYGFGLGHAAWQSWNLRPKPPFFRFVDDGFDSHIREYGGAKIASQLLLAINLMVKKESFANTSNLPLVSSILSCKVRSLGLCTLDSQKRRTCANLWVTTPPGIFMYV